MKKIFAAVTALLISTAAVSAENFLQGGLNVGTNIVEIESSHEITFCWESLFLGYKGYHNLFIRDGQEGEKMVPSENYEAYIPTLFLGYHGEKFYFTIGADLKHRKWAHYNEDFSLMIPYPTVTIGWDVPLLNFDPHIGVLNFDLSWYYNNLGSEYSWIEDTVWFFIPKASVGAKYRFNIGSSSSKKSSRSKKSSQEYSDEWFD